MLTLAEIRQNRTLANSIDWAMTPEKAVEMYLEWGTSWSRGNDFVSSASDESYYFVIYDWEKEPPCVTLLHRTVAGAEELAKIEVPKDLFEASCKEGGIKPGGTVQSLNRALQDWLNARIDGPPVEWFSAGNTETVILAETAFQLTNIPSVETQQKAGWKHPALSYPSL